MQGIPFTEFGPSPAIVPPFSPFPEALVDEPLGLVVVEPGVVGAVGVVSVVGAVPAAIEVPLSIPMTTSTEPAFTELLAVGVTPPSCVATAWAAAFAPDP